MHEGNSACRIYLLYYIPAADHLGTTFKPFLSYLSILFSATHMRDTGVKQECIHKGNTEQHVGSIASIVLSTVTLLPAEDHAHMYNILA